MSTAGLAQKHRPSAFYDGPAIDRCPTQESLLENAIVGSAQLLKALNRAGVRP